MTAQVVTLEPQAVKTGVRRVDTGKGSLVGALSSQWFKRPDDERFLSLDELYQSVLTRAERSWVETAHCKQIRLGITRQWDEDDPVESEAAMERLDLILPSGRVVRPNHWSFGQICQQIQAPASYLRTLPPQILERPLAFGLARYRGEVLKFYASEGAQKREFDELRASTSVTYGRIYDHEVVAQVMKFAGEGSGWKIPGVMNWGTGEYDPDAPVDKRSTTLYASDRDVFIFMCRDQYPIEVGKLPNGDPDLLFPGFIVGNSETGARTMFIETMYLRAVCQNRNLWGVENHSTVRIRHTTKAPERFALEAGPALLTFAREATMPVIAKVKEAKATMVAKNEEEGIEFLTKQKLSRTIAAEIMRQAIADNDGRPPSSVWDMVQGVSAYARDIPFQDDRLAMEKLAGKWMDKIAA